MKLGEGGEAFFVFETSDEIPASLQTSPLVSPTASPRTQSQEDLPSSLQEPEFLDLEKSSAAPHSQDAKAGSNISLLLRGARASSDLGTVALSLVKIRGSCSYDYRCHDSSVTVS